MSHRQRQRLHPDVLKLGMVSFLTDVSSEMIFAVFAVFFTTVAGASSALLGLIEGLADFSASSLNYLAGWMSDRSGRRKWFAIAGYAFSTSAKIILLASSSIAALSVFRVIERLGKGFRGPPRDAWLASLQTSPGLCIWRAGSRQDRRCHRTSRGLCAAVMAGESASTYATLFWVAFVPAVISVLVLTRSRPARRSPRARGRATELAPTHTGLQALPAAERSLCARVLQPWLHSAQGSRRGLA
jgi:MFS family permease